MVPPVTHCAVGTALGPIITRGMLVVSPGVPQVLFSQGHPRRSTEVRCQDSSSRTPGSPVGGSSDPGPAPVCPCPQSPELLRQDPSQLQEAALVTPLLFACHLTVALPFCGGPGLFPQTLLVVAVPLSSPFRLSLYSQHQSSLWVCPLNQHPAPTCTNGHASQAGACRSLSYAYHKPVVLSSEP